MIKNVVFDFGGVLVEWDPHRLYDDYFGDKEKADWFLANICTMEWNSQMDAGKPFSVGIAELSGLHPEWSTEIHMYYDHWIDMMGNQIPGMQDLVLDLKHKGFRLFGLTNWSAETFPLVEHRYEIFSHLDGMIVSGYEHRIKSSADYFALFLDRFSLTAEECLFIDDNQANVDGAIRIGMNAVRFQNAEQLKEFLKESVVTKR